MNEYNVTVVLDRLKVIINEALLVPPEDVHPESRLFSDLNAESIDIVDIRFRIEQEFGLKIDQATMMNSLGDDLTPTAADELFTVDWVVSYIRSQLEQNGE